MNIVLVHGSYAGGWIWELVRPDLERRGHRVTAIDLPISDPHAGAEAYARTIVDAVDWSDPPVLVGHSSSGLVTPLVAAERPVGRLVFLAAMLARPGMSANEQRQAEPIDAPTAPTTAEWTDLGDDVWRVGPATATEIFWHDAAPDVAARAAARLRPQSYRFVNEPSPLAAWPAVPSAYIVCRDDHATNPAWQRTGDRTPRGRSGRARRRAFADAVPSGRAGGRARRARSVDELGSSPTRSSKPRRGPVEACAPRSPDRAIDTTRVIPSDGARDQ
jgi:Alpha/beta hydrolase family